MENLTFSILDLLFFTGFFLLLVRVKGNGILRELVFFSLLTFYSYVTLNNINFAYNYFEEKGFVYGDEIYNTILVLLASAGLPFLNFFTGVYVPKIKGLLSMILGCIIALIRFMLLTFFILKLFPSFYDSSLVYNSFVINFLLSHIESLFVYLLI